MSEIKNNNVPTKTDANTQKMRGFIEHRATWMGLLIDEAKKAGLSTEFAHKAILRCGCFHGNNKYSRTDDLTKSAPEFANPDVVDIFEMEILEQSEKALNIDFHYCPLLAAWRKLGLPEEDMPELCDIAMDGDRGIISTYANEGFSFELGKTLAKGDDVCQIRISKK